MIKVFVATLLLCLALNAQQAEVRHKHVFGGSKATIQITPEGLTVDQLRIETYEESKTNSAKGRDYVYDRLPKEFVDQIRPVLRRNLIGRFIDAGPMKESPFENR